MKKFSAVCAAVLFVGALVAPVIAQAQAPAAKLAPKGTEGPDCAEAGAEGHRGPGRPQGQEEDRCLAGTAEGAA